MNFFTQLEAKRDLIPDFAQYPTNTTKSWVDFPNATTLTTFAIGPQWRDFYLQEFEALAEQGFALQPLETRKLSDSLINTTQTQFEPGLTMVLTNLNEKTDSIAMEYLLHRSVFANGFHHVIARSTTYNGLIESLQVEFNNGNELFLPLSDENATFTLKVESYKGAIPRQVQNDIRTDILQLVPTFNAKVNLDQPQHIYTIFIVQHLLDEKTQTPLIKEHDMRSQPYAYYFTKQIMTKRQEDYLLNTFALNKRPYIGPTSCDTTLAFCMANMSGCNEATSVFDPFNGTGSILCSARQFSPNVLGQDLDIDTLYGLYRDKGKKHAEFLEQQKAIDEAKMIKKNQRKEFHRQQYEKQLEEKKRLDEEKVETENNNNNNHNNTPDQDNIVDDELLKNNTTQPEPISTPTTNTITDPTPKSQTPTTRPPKQRVKQIKGLTKQQHKTIFDNYIHYNFSRPELICADSSHSPYRQFQYTGPNAQSNIQYVTQETPQSEYIIKTLPPQTIPCKPQITFIPGLQMYKTVQGKAIDQDLCDQQIKLEEEYMKNVIVPAKTELLKKYFTRHNNNLRRLGLINNDDNTSKDSRTEEQNIQEDVNNNIENVQFTIPELPYQPVRPCFDIIACDPPYGIRARAAKIATHTVNDDSSTTTTTTATSTPTQLTTADAASFLTRIRNTQSALKEQQNKSPEDVDSTSTNTTTTTNTNTNTNSTVKERRLFTVDDVAIDRYCPETVHNPMHNILYDLFDYAAQYLPIGGKLVYLLPTSKSLPKSLLPTHPCLKIKYAASQTLPTWFNRWAIVMEKDIEYNHEKHSNWIQEQIDNGEPLWSTACTARARLLANNLHHFDVKFLYQAKADIDQYGYVGSAELTEIQ